MSQAMVMTQVGGPEVLQWQARELPAPGAGEVRIRHTAIGLNYIDTYQRSGLYPVVLPTILGGEAAGVVEAVGPQVTAVQVGQRVAYGSAPLGAYAEARNIPADRLISLPDTISDQQAAAMLVKGMTAYYLLHQTYAVRAGETILFHAAAVAVDLRGHACAIIGVRKRIVCRGGSRCRQN